jgi:hypothetical protein
MDFDRDDWIWLASDEGRRSLDRLIAQSASPKSEADLAKWLRWQFSSSRSALLLGQLHLANRSATRFPSHPNWLWTEKLLEQSSDEFTSRMIASFYSPEVEVWDVCCGAGADSVALAGRAPMSRVRMPVTSVDHNWLACLLANHNLGRSGVAAKVCQRSAQEIDAADIADAALHIDPDRRALGRTTRTERSSPDRPWMDWAMTHGRSGSIKLAPATAWVDASLGTGLQWVGWGRSVRQQRCWWNTDAFPAGTRTVSVMEAADAWRHFRFTDKEIQAAFPIPEQEPTKSALSNWIGAYLGDTDPTVRAAGVNGVIASRCQAKLVGGEHGYLTADRPSPSILVDWFAVEACLPLDVKKIRQYFRNQSVGRLEIKKRGIELDIDKFRRELRLSGENNAWLVLARQGRAFGAIVARRLSPEQLVEIQ